jgi:hypothetical protein
MANSQPKPPSRIEGPTPNGGAYAIIYEHDNGSIEAVEFDADGKEILRTYTTPFEMRISEQRAVVLAREFGEGISECIFLRACDVSDRKPTRIALLDERGDVIVSWTPQEFGKDVGDELFGAMQCQIDIDEERAENR